MIWWNAYNYETIVQGHVLIVTGAPQWIHYGLLLFVDIVISMSAILVSLKELFYITLNETRDIIL